MKVICTSQCKDSKTLYFEGQEYDIPKELFDNNKDFFKKVTENKKEEKPDEK